ncbi:maleylpyruvate isomerase N-terminal domain-containing protein [Allostreptomyces psammosilenae]|uniref:Uncharacterized protein (TIGR03083 family) n=1 Tax=Allostreptomyces psammosilenae TaxID=1892865 RepID=A0A853A9E4_9ACTN|nr:maleylpyruvate isomerase N-terminal domain-containing protein [Allostreptomyces psammosilenae]NYI07032.1 uncharacterized protein (TIGR03083 family) [Allostreptomyces psammosilenae]
MPLAPHPALTAFTTEAEALAAALSGLPEERFDAPTRCVPWTLRDLLGHVHMTIGRVPGMLAAPAPADGDGALVTAAGYYRPDERFSAATNAVRVDGARELAAGFGSGRELVRELAAGCARVAAAVAAEPADRRVRTRHGDPMTLDDFMTTRVVELAVHGLDAAEALGRPAWLTDRAAEVVLGLLFAGGQRAALAATGWDPVTCLAKATGRAGLNDTEREIVSVHGIRWLALG